MTNVPVPLLVMAGVLLALVVIILILSRGRGLPQGEPVYSDLGEEETPAKPFFSEKHRLAGKPDMILRKGDKLIPVEIKSSPGRDRPYPSHVLQLAAYCLLMEEHYGVPPEYGIIRYRDKQFEIPYDDKMKEDLFGALDMMRHEKPKTHLPPLCSNPRKCLHCGFSAVCRPPESE